MEHIKQEIKTFYDAQASKFSSTRKKPWPEFFYIKEQVEKIISKKGKIKILELGCGDGRLYRYLVDVFPQELIEYTGVDISEQLINIAKQHSEDADFVVSDMISFLEEQEQQTYDFVIAVASFQHIPTKWERLLILKNIYRVLEYDGICQMFNWSFSNWFFKKYTKQIAKAFLIWILTLFTKPLNDIYVPWKDKDKTYYRYYHIFFLYELKNLFKQAGFVVQERLYITREGIKSISWKNSRNSMIIAKKTIVKI